MGYFGVGDGCGAAAMARVYADDLRLRILTAYEQNEGICAELADRFRVSVGQVVKIRGQQLRTGQKERRKHGPDRKPKFTEPVREQLRHWLVERPDLTLGKLQHGVPQFATDSGSAYRGSNPWLAPNQLNNLAAFLAGFSALWAVNCAVYSHLHCQRCVG